MLNSILVMRLMDKGNTFDRYNGAWISVKPFSTWHCGCNPRTPLGWTCCTARLHQCKAYWANTGSCIRRVGGGSVGVGRSCWWGSPAWGSSPDPAVIQAAAVCSDLHLLFSRCRSKHPYWLTTGQGDFTALQAAIPHHHSSDETSEEWGGQGA